MPTSELEQLLAEKIAASHFHISSAIQAKIVEYILLLVKWNQAYNLTSVRDPKEMITRHILDSLSLQPFLVGNTILDVGSGAGLPGIPLAFVEPQRAFVLLDSNIKKTTFLTQVKHELKLQNLRIVHARVENFHPEELFDCITCRAFSSLSDFVKLTAHLLKPNGRWLAMKGEYPLAEIAALEPIYNIDVEALAIPGIDAKRHIVKILTLPNADKPSVN